MRSRTTVGLGTIARTWRAECERWRIPPLAAVMVFAIPFAGAIALAVLAVWRRMYLFLVNEDGPLEWSQFLAWGVAALCAVVLAQRFASRRTWILAGLWLLFGIGCLGAAGEEISWGQRVLGFDTPDNVQELNEQDETTIHNLGVFHTLFRITMLGVGVYGSFLAVGVRLFDNGRHASSLDLALPPLFLTAPFFVLAVYRSVRILLFPDPGPMLSGYGEWAETCLAFGIMAFTALVLWAMPGRNQNPCGQPHPLTTPDGRPEPGLEVRPRG